MGNEVAEWDWEYFVLEAGAVLGQNWRSWSDGVSVGKSKGVNSQDQ
jgi:hypothetical protein